MSYIEHNKWYLPVGRCLNWDKGKKPINAKIPWKTRIKVGLSAAPNLHLICDKIATFTKKLVKKCSKYDNNGVDYCQYSGILGVKSETCRAFDEQDSCLNSNVKLSQIKRRTTWSGSMTLAAVQWQVVCIDNSYTMMYIYCIYNTDTRLWLWHY